ncbi:MAG: NAD(P)H-hydrate dehydratase [Mycobacteriales bacterium]
MRQVHTVAEVRAAEAALMAGLPTGALMQQAAAGLARRLAELLGQVYGARVVLLVGAGNNGADAMWAGARLAARGASVTALTVGGPEPEALAALHRAGGRSRPAEDLSTGATLDAADLVVDGLVGIGGHGPLRPDAAAVVERLAGTSARVVAVDVPSGVDADSGRVEGAAVRADVTVTFGTYKPGLVVSPGAEYAGLLELVDIGLGPHLPPTRLTLLDSADLADLLPAPAGEATKYSRGVVGVVAGSDAYTGAAVLATGGAVRAGAGMVRYAGPAHAAEQVRTRWPEAVVTVVPVGASGTVADPEAVLAAGRVQAWVVGPGVGTDEDAAAVVEAVLGTDVPVLVDADGLTVLARHPDWLARRTAPTLLTPHAGEFARLMGGERAEVEGDRLAAARRAADALAATVLLKGSTTVVADPGGEARVNSTGSAWLATAGSGDVLSGACGALLAGGLSALDAGSCGAFLHGLAGLLAATGPEGAQAPIAAADLLASWRDAERAVRARP